MKLLVGFSFLTFLFCANAQETNAPLVLEKTIPLENVEGRIDHMAVDVAGQKLFIAALGNNTVEVVDLKSGKRIQSLSGFAEPQGIAYVPEFDKIFVSNGSDGACRILDGHSFKTVGSIKLGNDADNVRYDEKAKQVYIGYGDGALAVLNATNGAKIADMKLAAHPEAFQLKADSAQIFVNIPEAGQIAIVDREKKSVTVAWPLKGAESNFPLALDETNHRLFVGCRKPAEILIYDFSGKLISTVSISRDVDDLYYDADKKQIYASCGGGAIEVVEQTDANHYEKIATIPTASGARTSLFVPQLKLFCLAVPHCGNQLAEVRVYKIAP